VGSRLGRYEIIKHLTSGGMAELLLARAGGLEGFERHVVIKRIRVDRENDQRFIEMFLHEARLAGSLHHHNIVQVYDIGEENGKPYFAMEYVHGEDLRTVLRRLHERAEQMPLQHLVTIMSAVATALHHAHEQRGPNREPLDIVHRDVTPANILVGYDGNVKVVDFGIARAAAKMTETQSGMLAGKAPYLAPEQCTGGSIDRRSDVFAVGTVMFELATVRRLFKGDNEFLTMSSIVKGTVPKPSTFRKDLPPELDEIVLRALAREPAARYQNAGQLHDALETFAIKHGLRTSGTALAAYMKQLFGERPEPWIGDYKAPVAAVDFDGLGTGVVAVLSDDEANAIPQSVRLTKSSPIARALETMSTPRAAVVIPPATAAPVPVAAAGSEATSLPTSTTPGVAIPRTRTPVPAPMPARSKPKTIQIPVPKPADADDDEDNIKTTVVSADAVETILDARPAAPVLPKATLPGTGAPVRPTPTPKVTEESVTEAQPITSANLDLPAPAPSSLPSWSKLSKPETPTVTARPLAKLELAKAPARRDGTPIPGAKPDAAKPSSPKADAAKPDDTKLDPSKPTPIAAKALAVMSEARRTAPKPVEPARKDDDDDTVAQDPDLLDLDPPEPAASALIVSPRAIGARAPDPTEVVTPLPAPVPVFADGTDVRRPAPRNKKVLYLAAAGGVAVLAAVLAVVIGISGGDATRPEPVPTVTSRANNVAPAVDEAPRKERTWANSEKPAGMETAPTPAPEPAIVEPAPVEPAPEPVIAEPAQPEPNPKTTAPKPAPKKKTVAKKQVKKVATKPVSKPAAKPTKPTPAAQPGWDPNSLFPKKR
jgi:serine/threonine protein kinase